MIPLLQPPLLQPPPLHEPDQKQRRDVFSPISVSRASCGLYHSMAIAKRRGVPQLYGWGKNHNNVMGFGSEVLERTFPGQIGFYAKSYLYSVSCGINHSMTLVKQPSQTGGKVYACGLGNRGRLGFTKIKSQEESIDTEAWFTPKPIRVKFPDKQRIARIACGSDHTLAISDKGELFSWGIGQYGALGTGETIDEYFPVRVIFGSRDSVAVHCAGGGKHSIACTSDGRCYSWGHGGNGRLGLGHSRASLSPTLIDYLSDRDVVHVSAGEAHSACIDKMGILLTWGAGAYGRLGHGEDSDMPVPRKVEEFGGITIIQVACGTFHTMAVSRTGALYGWGAGLGLGLGAEGDNTSVLVPKQVHEGGIGTTVCQVAVGTYHTIAITLTGDILCWGVGGQSRLGHGDNVNQPYPKQTAELRNRGYIDDIKACLVTSGASQAVPQGTLSGNNTWRVVSLRCGGTHSMVLTAEGHVWVWGSHSRGQLGLGDESTDDVHSPVHLSTFKEPITAIACGQEHSLAVSTRGDVFVWGDGSQGQLGLGRIMDVYVPTGIATLTGVFEVAAGGDYSCCLVMPHYVKSDATGGSVFAEAGDIWTWGSCEAGKLGHEGLSSGCCVSPKKVHISVPISKVACGRSHMVSCSPNGETFSWGAGYYGRLGNGSAANSPVPLRVLFPEPTVIVDVSAGAFHSMAIDSMGALWTWGRDTSVCLNDHAKSPQRFERWGNSAMGQARCKAIACCGEHSFVLSQTGEVWAWGDNSKYQLGLGKRTTTDFVSQPEVLSRFADIVELVATGPEHSSVALRSGDVYAWGACLNGRLGIGVKRAKFCPSAQVVDAAWLPSPSAYLQSQMPAGTSHTTPRDDRSWTPAYRTEEKIRLDTSIADQVCQFLERLKYPSDDSNFAAVQQLAKNEPRSNRASEIKNLEDDLVKIFGRFLDVILKIPEGEAEIRQLRNAAEQQIARVVVNVECDAPSPLPHDKPAVPDEYFSKLSFIHNLIYYLQTQPAYFVHLSAAVNNDMQRQLLLSSVRQIYGYIEDQHIHALFMGLCAAVCAAEVEAAPDILRLFRPQDSIFINLLGIFSTLTPNLRQFAHLLLDPTQDGSAAQTINMLDELVLALDVEKLLDLSGTVGIASQQDTQKLFHTALENVQKIIWLTTNALPLLPVGVKALIKHAYDCIIARDFLFDASEGRSQSTSYSLYPIARLLLQGILGRVWKDPETFSGFLECSPFTSPKSSVNIRTLWVFVNSAFEDDFVNYRSGHLLREIFQSVYSRLAEHAASLINTTPEGYIRVELTLGLYYMHFHDENHFVTLRSDTTAALINLIKEYSAHLYLSVYDPVAEVQYLKINIYCEVVDYFRADSGRGLKSVLKLPDTFARNFNIKAMAPNARGHIFSQQLIEILEANPYYHNVHIPRRDRNAVMDPVTGAAVPQVLALRQQAHVQDGRTVVALIQRYVPPDVLDPRSVVADALRLAPPATARTWAELIAELQVVQEFFSRQDPPKYAEAQVLAKAAKYAIDFESQEISEESILRWIGEGLKTRESHRAYLQLVQDGEDRVASWERTYQFNQRKRNAALQEVLQSLSSHAIEPAISQQMEAARLVPKIHVIAMMIASRGFAEDTRPTVTVQLRTLVKYKIATTCRLDQAVIPRISVTFTSAGDGGWRVSVVEVSRQGDRIVDQFELSSEDMERLRHLAPASEISYGQKLISFQLAPLMQFLLRAAVQPLRPNL